MAHGFYDNGRCWEPLASELADEYEVVTNDGRGHGKSDTPETGYGIDDRVADLVGVIELHGLETPMLIGHSMGGSTVAWTAATHQAPKPVVLEEPAGMDGDPKFGPEERVGIVHDRLDEWAVASIDDITADHDDLDPDRHIEEMEAAERLANGRFFHLPGARHTVFRDRFPTSAKELRPFLRRI